MNMNISIWRRNVYALWLWIERQLGTLREASSGSLQSKFGNSTSLHSLGQQWHRQSTSSNLFIIIIIIIIIHLKIRRNWCWFCCWRMLRGQRPVWVISKPRFKWTVHRFPTVISSGETELLNYSSILCSVFLKMKFDWFTREYFIVSSTNMKTETALIFLISFPTWR